ncbi:MAG TPA: hypothetical protein PK957_04290 [Candidatus Dojkabacteria bacterium]|nr:hypothetical protein [Candidatus Dojkabacteria bacterium]
MFRIRARTSLEGISTEKYPQLKALFEKLDSLTCRCIYRGREATKDVAHVSISDEGVLQVIQNASCQGCLARGWEARSSGTFAIEIQNDIVNGLPIPVCAHCGGALPGANVDPEGKLVNTPNECPSCRSTESTVVYVPVNPPKEVK